MLSRVKVFNFFNKHKVNITILAVVLLIANINKNIGLYNHETCIIENDVVSYYAYLPAFFIYNDIGLTFKDSTDFSCKHLIWATKTSTGKYVIKTSMGVAIAYMPFFLVTHYVLKYTNNEACGYSPPYKIALVVSSVFFLFLGLIFVKRTLRLFFDSDWIILSIIPILSFGTNLYFYTVYEPAYSHVYSFALISVFIYYSVRWVRDIYNVKYAIILGIFIGWISLTRPTNIVIALFPITLFFLQHSIKEIFNIRFIKIVSLIAILAIVIWIPQLLYWKYVTGNYFYYSYGSNERFFFDNPRIIKGLLGFRKGFFIYTPIMIVAFIGFYFLFKKNKNLFLAASITTLIYIYITFSWWCWWYGGSLGMRPFIDFYSLWSLTLASFMYYMVRFRYKFFRVISILLVIFFSYMNIEYTLQYKKGRVHYDSMTWEAYKCVFFTKRSGCDVYSLLCCPNYELAQKGIDRCD
ncbi:MAG: hypothetical protein NZ529_05090 [Cytophagaceae bacterium]|nr:hypothetical protein [Cytophagaceae bacterium]MDW8456151.1 hypothetical protein [Cytophagaceae bacterium]